MPAGFSQLRSILQRQALTPADLVRRVSEQGDRVNAKSLYRLADPQEPLEKVDMRVIAAVCQALSVGIGDILTFDEPTIIEGFPPDRQARLDALTARRTRRTGDALTAVEVSELTDLLGEAETIALGNARRLAKQGKILRATARRASVLDAVETPTVVA